MITKSFSVYVNERKTLKQTQLYRVREMEELQSVVTIPEDHDFDGLTESERIVKKILEVSTLLPCIYEHNCD